MERDYIDENPQHRAWGAWIVAWGLLATAVYAPMPWWGGMLVMAAAWCGLIMVAGLKIKWSYPDW